MKGIGLWTPTPFLYRPIVQMLHFRYLAIWIVSINSGGMDSVELRVRDDFIELIRESGRGLAGAFPVAREPSVVRLPLVITIFWGDEGDIKAESFFHESQLLIDRGLECKMNLAPERHPFLSFFPFDRAISTRSSESASARVAATSCPSVAVLVKSCVISVKLVA